MKLVAFMGTALLITQAGFAAITGAWTAESEDGMIQLHMRVGRTSNFGQTYPASAFKGLSVAQTTAATATPVAFALDRDAGSFRFEGSFRQSLGSGHFTFTPDRNFGARIEALGVTADEGELEDRDLLMLAALDVSEAYVRELAGLGYGGLDLDEVTGARIHRVTAERVRQYRELGYSDIELEDAMALSIHRVTPEFVAEMREAGMRVEDPDDVVALRIHRVTPEFIREMRSLGYGDIDSDDLVGLQIHRVSPEFVREIRALGYENVDADDLVGMRIHGVTPEFIRDANQRHGERLEIDDLVSMRIVGERTHKRRRH